MRIGSLCSGVGGLELGMEWAGVGRTVWQAEIDPHASQVLARHWPDVPNVGDLRNIDDMTPVDVLCAGYPCQPFSTAGRRKGTDDDRHLWPAVRDAVAHLGPRLVVLENVRGHLSLGFGDVLGDLADLGFDARWGVLRASDVGACHQRPRVFIVAWHSDGAPSDALTAQRRPRHRPGEPSGPTTDPSDLGHERPGGTRRREHGSPHGGDAATDTDGDGLKRREEHHSEPSAGWVPERQPRMDPDGHLLDWGPYAPAITRWEHLTRPAPPPTDNGKLSPAFVEWMMGFPAGWTDGLTRTAALRCLGNAVVPQCAAVIGAHLPQAVPA